MLESEIKLLLKNLGESINETLSDSSEIHKRIQEIRDAGYEIFITIETKIGFCSVSEESCTANVSTLENENPVCLNLTEYDTKFLKSLKISVN